MDEKQLLERSREGDGNAFEALIEAHQDALYGLAVHILGNREDARDALQDSCIKAWRAMARQRGGSFRSWMNSIVARTCVDVIRARRPTSALEDEEGRVIPLPDPGPGPEGVLLAQEKSRTIESCLRTLSADHRSILLMRDLGGLSYEEIGDVLEIPIGTVRSRLARARVAMQDELMRNDPTILEAGA